MEVEKACHYSCEDADLTLLLANLLMPKIEADGFAELFHRVELPLIEVLATMEMNGVKLDFRSWGSCPENLRSNWKNLGGNL